MSYPRTDQPTHRSPEENLADSRWRLRHSAWLLAPILGFGFTSFVGFAYIAARARRRKWWIIAAIYAAVTAIALTLMSLNPTPEGKTGSGPAQSWGAGILFFLWMGSIVHGAILNKEYLRWRAVDKQPWYLSQAVPGNSTTAPMPAQSPLPPQLTGLGMESSNFYQEGAGTPSVPRHQPVSHPGEKAPTAPLVAPPNWAPVSTPGRSTTTHPSGEAQGIAATVDVNSATQADLMRLPGVNADLAAQLVGARIARGGFADLDDFARTAQFQPHEFARLRSLIWVSQRRQQGGTSTSRGGRILDI